MSHYIIDGGEKLLGSITTNSSKNAAVVILAATLLNDGKTILKNVPKIEEVFRLIEILTSLGSKIKWTSDHSLEITSPKKITIDKINKTAAEKTRSIIMFIGPLIHKLNKFSLPSAGGCKLGRRTVLPHFYALENLGVKIIPQENSYQVSWQNLHNANKIVLYESGDTVTENIVLAASRIDGITTIKYASANYQVQDLCFFLEKLGIKIKGIGSTTLTVYGQKSINKTVEYSISEDPIESMLFISIAATTNSELTIKRCPIDFLDLELLKLEKMGFCYKIIKSYKAENSKTNLVDIKTYKSKLMAPAEKLEARPYPGVNIDNLPFFVPIATQAQGKTLIHDWVYENRAIYYIELNRLGANLTLADPHRVFIDGPTALKSADIDAPPALRPSAIILVAMLAARGKSILRNIYGIERGYENLVGRLQKIGAKIKRVK